MQVNRMEARDAIGNVKEECYAYINENGLLQYNTEMDPNYSEMQYSTVFMKIYHSFLSYLDALFLAVDNSNAWITVSRSTDMGTETRVRGTYVLIYYSSIL